MKGDGSLKAIYYSFLITNMKAQIDKNKRKKDVTWNSKALTKTSTLQIKLRL